MSVLVTHSVPIIGQSLCRALGPRLREPVTYVEEDRLTQEATCDQVDVAVVDEGSAISADLYRRLARADVAVLLLSSARDGLANHLADGARGVVDAHEGIDAIVVAITSVRAGHTHLPPQLLSSVLRELILAGRQPGVAGSGPWSEEVRRVRTLSRREHEVLEMLTEGADHTDIAQRLHIAPSTAKTHIARLLTKLGARSRVEAVEIALREGMVATSRGEIA